MFKKIASFCSIVLLANSAYATNGFLGHCVGADNCGTAGAGASNPGNAIDGVINPALLAQTGNNWSLSLGALFADVTLEAKGPFANVAAGKQKSKADLFPEASGGVTYQVNEALTLALSFAGSGGLAAKFDKSRTVPQAQISPEAPYDKSVFYRLAHLAPSVSFNVNDKLSLGAAVLVGYSDFKTDFAKQEGRALVITNGKNKRDSAFGYGARIGAYFQANDMFSFGGSFASPVKFEKFKKYNDVMPKSLDTPMNFVVGTKINITPETKVLFDVKQYYFSKVDTLGKKPPFGFGWKDQTVFMFGVKHSINKLTLSAGYNYGKTQIPKDQVFANALVPANSESHVNLGLAYKFDSSYEFQASTFYSPRNTVTEAGTGDNFSMGGKGTKSSTQLYGFKFGIKSSF